MQGASHSPSLHKRGSVHRTRISSHLSSVVENSDPTQWVTPRHATCPFVNGRNRHTTILRSDLTGEFPVSDVIADSRGPRPNTVTEERSAIRSPSCHFGDDLAVLAWRPRPTLRISPCAFTSYPLPAARSELFPPTLHIPNRVYSHIYLPLVFLERLMLYPLAQQRVLAREHTSNNKSP